MPEHCYMSYDLTDSDCFICTERRLGKLDRIYLTELRNPPSGSSISVKKIDVPSPPTGSGFWMFTRDVER
jgi:hypothetical protein